MTDEQIDVETLWVSSVDSTPRNVESWRDTLGEDYDEGGWWNRFEYEDGDTTWDLLDHTGSVVAVILEGGHAFTTYENYTEWWDDQYLDTDEYDQQLSEREWDDLFNVSPSSWGSEGPMMNYWYPVDHIDDDDEARDAAVKLLHVPLCVVKVGEDYGIALTGGGMDFSWDICKAFVLLGTLPPVHFADLPNQGEWDEDVYQAMLRSLTWMRDNMEHRITRLVDLKARVAERMAR